LAPKNYKAKRFSFVILGAKISAKKRAKNVDEIDTQFPLDPSDVQSNSVSQIFTFPPARHNELGYNEHLVIKNTQL